jgi:protocatechuate 3,4-dioxygenase beta subunit
MAGRLPLRRIPNLLVLAMTTTVASATQVATGTAPGPRTGLIAGQVVDSTGAPVPEAVVTMTLPAFFSDTTTRGRVMADGEGRFFFADLPPGDYYLGAVKDGYTGGVYGQRQPSGPDDRLPLAAGGRRVDVRLQLWKNAVLAGRVVDESGEPVVGISVRALERNVIGGRRVYGDWGWLVPVTTTDDRGMFRLSQVRPGIYAVVVPSAQATVPATFVSGPDPSIRSELYYAGVPEIGTAGQPRTLRMGEVAMVTLSTVLIPPPPTSSGRVQVYRTTYYPSATTAGAAAQVTVGPAEERTDLTIAMRPTPAVRVSGRLVAPDGSAPPPMALRLSGDAATDIALESRASSTAESGFDAATGMSDARGRFTFIGVPPGSYVLSQANPFLDSRVQQGLDVYWVSQRITVGADDLTDLTVEARQPLRIDARIEFLSASGPQPRPADFLNLGVTLERPFGGSGQFAVFTREGLTFTTFAEGGQYSLVPTERVGWVLRSMTADGRDITDRVLDLRADTTLVLTYTDRPSKVTGAVRDARGEVNTTAMVLAFPADPQRWVGSGRSSRTIKSVPATNTGSYTFAHLPPGAYNLIAVNDLDDEWSESKHLEALARQATKLTVVDGQPASLDLTVKVIR